MDNINKIKELLLVITFLKVTILMKSYYLNRSLNMGYVNKVKI